MKGIGGVVKPGASNGQSAQSSLLPSKWQCGLKVTNSDATIKIQRALHSCEMSGTGQWRILKATVESAPQLLVRGKFSTSGYEVSLTDLSHIWQTSTTKREIIQQASEIGSSIDPSQDDQFQIFVSKIESAINGDNGTSLNIHATKENGTHLSIELSAILPGSLPVFTWNLELELLPRHDTERLLISPLLRQASQLQTQLQLLVSELHDKDRVISKICDRLETSGNDLTTVFPGVSNIKTNRKKGQREQLARHVKGLADFDEDAWKAQAASFDGNGGLGHDEVNAILSGLPFSDADAKTSRANTDWWKHLGDSVTGEANGRNGSEFGQRGSFGNSNGTPADESMEDGDFQTQNTPPHLKRHNSVDPYMHPDSTTSPAEPEAANHDSAAQKDDDSTTEDEDDPDAAPPRTHSARAPPSGGSQQNSQSPSPRKLGKLGGRQGKDSAPEIPGASSAEKSPEPKPLSRLGNVGGKAKAIKAVNVSPKPEAEVSGIGSSAGKKATREAATSDEDAVTASVLIEAPIEEERVARSSAKVESPLPREDSQERADRKRDQLKRALEEKAKAPVKKKRKF